MMEQFLPIATLVSGVLPEFAGPFIFHKLLGLIFILFRQFS